LRRPCGAPAGCAPSGGPALGANTGVAAADRAAPQRAAEECKNGDSLAGARTRYRIHSKLVIMRMAIAMYASML